ncbi:MAG: CRISPR-associated helicase Cas3' [Oscillospiraceae bacterium]
MENVSSICACFCEKMGLKSTAKLCGILHDIGKYNKLFQEQIKKAQANETNTHEKFDHGVFGAKFIYNILPEKDRQLRENIYKKLTIEIISEVICYHHGGLPDNINDENQVTLIARLNKITDDELDEVVNIFYKENPNIDINALLEQATKEIECSFKKLSYNKTLALGFFIKHIYSILVDADRLDSYLFETDEKFDNRENSFDEVNSLWNEYSKKLEEQLENFKKNSPASKLEKTVAKTRSIISDDCMNVSKKGKSLYSLTVPTGGGKTLSSLRFALNHCIQNKLQKIIYVVPFTTIIEQNAQVVRETLDCKDNLLEFHSNIVDENKNPDYEILSQRWNSPLIFTTMVQFLNTAFGDTNSNIRRLHNLENSVIIFDEIQALPIKCTYLFYEYINYLMKMCGCTIVLCTATQPNLEVVRKKIKIEEPTEIIKNVDVHFENLKRMEIVDMTKEKMSTDKSGEFAVGLSNKNTSLLVILNTVRSAENTFNKIKELAPNNTKLFFLSTHLCPKHREKVIEELRTALGNNEKLICVSTQLIEAGVDISFDSVVRSLCKMDSIAQAIGRGNRNGKNNYGTSYIIRMDEREENVSRLKEIKIGQDKTSNFLNLFNINPQKYNNSILSPISLNKYFKEFFTDDNIQNEMCYKIKDCSEESIYSLLEERSNRKNRTLEKYPLIFSYQFKTARKMFHVIDQETVPVIVGYGEGNEIIENLQSSMNIGEKFKQLQKAQKYTVNIFKDLYDKLEKNGGIQEFDGIAVLNEGFYDEDIGITTNKYLPLCEY